MGLKEWLTKRSVQDLASEIDAALLRLAEAQGLQAECEVALAAARADVQHAREDLSRARDALFREHPELAPDPAPDGPIPALQGGILVTDSAWDPTPVEVDDDSDPRYTSGASAISPVDGDPLPPIEWAEHEDE